MNLIEAAKSGKPFKRRWMVSYVTNVANEYDAEGDLYFPAMIAGTGIYKNSFPLLAEDILADDWEVKE